MSHNANSKKRRREPYNVDVKLVEIYEDLANEKEQIRLKAAHKLVSRFTPEANPTADDAQKTLQRLFRGLSSGRKAARVGFSIALTEVLSQVFSPSRPAELDELSVAKVLDIWESSTRVSGGERGQEHRDHHFGRLFGAEAIVKSYILFHDSAFEHWLKFLTLVFELCKKKPWLREECGWVFYRAIYELASQKIDAQYAEKIIEGISTSDLAKTPEGVAIWLAVRDLFPNATLPPNVWKHDDPLDSHDKRTLSKVMRESSATEETAKKEGLAQQSSGVWSSKLHFAWDAVLTRIYDVEPAEEDKSKKSKGSRISFKDFWVEVIDNGLFASSSSEERKYWGFLVFMKILGEAPRHIASQIFTKNLSRCLMNQMADKDRYLYRMAVKAAKKIQERVEKEPEFAAAAVKGLIGPSGSINFDQVTKSDTISRIVAEAGPESLQSIVELLADSIAIPDADEAKYAASIRNYISRVFVSVVKARSSTGEEYQPILEEILSVLVRFAYFEGQQDGIAQPPLAQETQELFREKINLCMKSLITNSKDPAGVSYAVVRQIRNFQKSNEHGKFIIDMDETISESVDAAFKSLKKLSSKVKNESEDKKDPSIQAFRLLYSLTLLEVYNGNGDAVSMLDELAFCYSKFWGEKKSKKEDKSDASNALVEILLSFASKPSQLFRRMSEQVFGVFAEQITADGLDSLISVVEVEESLAGQQEMFDQHDDEDEEMLDADGSDTGSDSDSDSDSVEIIDADEEDDDDEEDEEELASFNAKLAEALGTHGENQELDSDSDMDDDQMEAVDEMLVKAFQARKQTAPKKKEKKDAMETVINFKNRVLDLLSIYVKKCHSSILALDLLLPLVRLSRKTKVNQIAKRANNILSEYTTLCKKHGVPPLKAREDDDDPIQAVWELLRGVHKEATLQRRQIHALAVSQASLILVRALVAHDRQNISQVVDIYADTLKSQLSSENCFIKPNFFADWNAWCVEYGKNLRR
ncbi:putative DNA polymerase V [Talaromyces proteolyticus]|uniref:DNA polymerase V n=1 Tax=Talaromyces proteolyticus TaxID=1131652 RepID=A0AAD4Q3W5_9EURO|nr:putative DNA polymerase V [Talaromyces proteolyticus]KAH8705519.1 putative DNA polymerase V [Talaromyces proteolyticus]